MKPNVLIRSRRKKLKALIDDAQLSAAKDYCDQILKLGTKDPKIQIMLGTVLRRLGDNIEAEQVCKAVLKLNDNYSEAHQVLGTALQCQGKMDEAVQSYRTAIRLAPKFGEAHYLLGNVLREQGLLDQAAKHYRETLKGTPDNIAALCNLGGTLTGLFQFNEASILLNKANSLQPGSTPVLCNIARVLQLTGKPDEAESRFREALRIDPNAVDVMVMLSELLEKGNRLDEAAEFVTRGLKILPNDAGLLLISAKLARRDKRVTDAISISEGALKESPTADKQNEFHHLLGLLYDKEGDHTLAFEHFTEGNRITSIAVTDKDRDGFLRSIDRNRNEFRAALPSISGIAKPELDVGQPDPVFLIGFPRSGTTLLEQVLDSHPQLRSLDEKPTVGAMMRSLEKIVERREGARISLTDVERVNLRKLYFKEVAKYVQLEQGQLLIDKFPLNLINVWHIWRVFPNAKFILAIRHPCDVCLSCFMQNFALNEAMTTFTSLEGTANLYESAFNYWQEFVDNIPLDYHMIRYEDLIEDVEQESRKTLNFLGLPWSEEVLGHVKHAQQRGTISTPSYHQVTQPIYKTARYRWKNYASQLSPVMETLNPFIERFDY